MTPVAEVIRHDITASLKAWKGGEQKCIGSVIRKFVVVANDAKNGSGNASKHSRLRRRRHKTDSLGPFTIDPIVYLGEGTICNAARLAAL
jgi:hypothetical protein